MYAPDLAPYTPPKALTVSQLALRTTEVASSSARPNPPSVPAPVAKTDQSKNEARIEEETRCREWLVRNDWMSELPDTSRVDGEMHCLSDLVAEYVEWRDDELIKRQQADTWPRNLRLWTCEFQWCMDELQRRGLLDDNLKEPHQTRIRESAVEAGGPFAEDPGNVCWDVMFGVTRLWKYVSDTGEWRVLRTDTREYGSQANKSGKGSCNFRGNILESLQCRLQKLASETHTPHTPTSSSSPQRTRKW